MSNPSPPSAPTGAAAHLAAKHASEQDVKLYGGWFCPFVQRAWITLLEKRVDHKYIEINPYDKSPSFLALNPRGLVPTLGLPPAADGSTRVLYESTIISEFLDETYADESQHGPSLLPRDAYARARARIWIDHVSSKIIPAYGRLLRHTPESDYTLDEARATLHGHILAFARQADPAGPWFLGEHFSLVDVALAPWAKRLFLIDQYKPGGTGIPTDAGGDEAWARWKTWFDAVVQRPSVVDTWSDDERYLAHAKRFDEKETK